MLKRITSLICMYNGCEDSHSELTIVVRVAIFDYRGLGESAFADYIIEIQV